MNEQITPDETWSLDQLGIYCKERSERMAVDAWLVGKAMVLAKERVKLENGSFTEWKRRHGFSDPTASRYMRLYKSYPSEDDQKKLTTIGIMQGLREAGITNTSSTSTASPRDEGDVSMMFGDNKPTAPENDACKFSDPTHSRGAGDERQKGSTTMTPAKPTNKKVPSVFTWAVSTQDSLAADSADDEPIYEQSWPDCESLDKELRITIPMQLSRMRDELQRVLDHGVNEVRKAWPADSMCRFQMMAEINEVAALLLRLFDTCPIKDEELAKSA